MRDIDAATDILLSAIVLIVIGALFAAGLAGLEFAWGE